MNVGTKRQARQQLRPRRTERISNPLIYVIGGGRTGANVEQALGRIEARIRRAPWSADLVEELEPNATAFVLVSPINGTSVQRAAATFLVDERLRRVPLFAVLERTALRSAARKLYKQGITAVFHWPLEATVLPYSMVEMIAADLVRGAPSGPDSALARATRAHLKTRCDFNHQVRVKVADQVAFLNGTVERLWQKDDLKRTTMEVPGLRGVLNRDVHVLPSRRTDSQLRQSIARILEEVSDLDADTLAVQIESGYVTLAGSVPRRRELNRLVHLISHTTGVRGIEKLTIVSPSRQAHDHRVAARLKKKLHQLFVGEEIDVAFFGGTAVLSGRVSSLVSKQRIEDYLADEDAIGRIIDKLHVEQTRKRR
jgi:osmotically-inducible protein OsmY